MTSIDLPSEQELRGELNRFATPSTLVGGSLFAIEYGIYVAAISGVLILPALPLKLLAGVVAGFQLGKLSLFAHDAAHGATTKISRLNKIIALLVMLPILYNYQLWCWDHHTMHHRFPNGDHPDAFVPYSKPEFDALPVWRRVIERFCRAPFVLGFGVYFVCVRWWSTKFFPRADVPANLHKKAWHYFQGLMLYIVIWATFLAMAPLYSNTNSVTAVCLGFLLPVFIFNTVFGAVLFFQHNHPDVPWFKGSVNREILVRPELVTAHLLMPRWAAKFMHSVFDHPVHHIHERIPLYRAFEAQIYLNLRMKDAPLVIEQFSVANLLRTLRVCKLYDYEKHCWLDFRGSPTTGTAPLVAPLLLQSADDGTAGNVQLT